MELIDMDKLCKLYENDIRKGSAANPATKVFDFSEEGKKRWADLKSRVVEHNIRIMAKYYTRITLDRMSELLELSREETEEFLSNMVVKGTVEAKTDRLDGIVNFKKTQNPNEMLNEWSHNISDLMGLVQKATHLINKVSVANVHHERKRSKHIFLFTFRRKWCTSTCLDCPLTRTNCFICTLTFQKVNKRSVTNAYSLVQGHMPSHTTLMPLQVATHSDS